MRRLRASGQPYLAYHPGLVRDALAYHGCAELFQVYFEEILNYIICHERSSYYAR